jgi:hypothetical protein
MLRHPLLRFCHGHFFRLAGIAGGMLLLSIVLGCMSFSFGGHEVSIEHNGGDGITCHDGTIQVPAHACLNVYYPAPFSSKPNLEVTECFGRCEILEQREDGFRVRNNSIFTVTAEWQARGLRIVQIPPTAVVPTEQIDSSAPGHAPVPAGDLPANPTPAKP